MYEIECNWIGIAWQFDCKNATQNLTEMVLIFKIFAAVHFDP